MSMKQDFNISEVAKLLGVHKDTILYWEENNLIPKARRNPSNNYRIYNIKEIEEIRNLRGLLV